MALSRADAAAARAKSRSRSARGSRRWFTRGGSARRLGLDRLFIKDESLNPTNSFKARGQSAGDHARQGARREHASRCRPRATPATPRRRTAAAAGLACQVFIPKDAKQPFIDECRLYGATVTLVDGLITDAGRIAARRASRSAGTTCPR